MHRLTPDAYPLVRRLFEGLRHNLFIHSIVDGHTPAWVYVDDLEAPRVAWLWDLQGEMAVAGDASRPAAIRDLGALIAGTVVPHARARGVPGLTLFCDVPAWKAHLDILLPGLEPESAARRRYAFAWPKLDWRAALPAASALHRLDEVWLDRRDVRHMDQVAGWVDSFWETHADFARDSFGFCLLRGDAVVSWCLGVFVSGRQVELGVATVPEVRGQGCATAVAARCVAFCAAHDRTPHWHCWEDNVASWRIAETIGFVRPTPYTVYHVNVGREKR